MRLKNNAFGCFAWAHVVSCIHFETFDYVFNLITKSENFAFEILIESKFEETTFELFAFPSNKFYITRKCRDDKYGTSCETPYFVRIW